jgi:uncharacterized protein YcbK (DUF882 family)
MKVSENFNRDEFACKCGLCERIAVDAVLLDILQKIRSHFGQRVKITSANRCPMHNAHVGGDPNSRHMVGIAADIQVAETLPEAVADYAETLLNNWGGIGRYKTFTHIDVRADKARWRA